VGVSLLLLFNSSGEQDTALPVTPVLQPASGTIGSGAIGSGTIAGLDVEERLDAIREAFEPRRELTGSEEALLAIVATCLHGVLTTDYVFSGGAMSVAAASRFHSLMRIAAASRSAARTH